MISPTVYHLKKFAWLAFSYAEQRLSRFVFCMWFQIFRKSPNDILVSTMEKLLSVLTIMWNLNDKFLMSYKVWYDSFDIMDGKWTVNNASEITDTRWTLKHAILPFKMWSIFSELIRADKISFSRRKRDTIPLWHLWQFVFPGEKKDFFFTCNGFLLLME